MQKISYLPDELIAKIAAGEVIERPAYAVKELLENSLDADADVIEIHIEESGLKRIIIQDNGMGMSKEDLAICFYPHTTSKITDQETLLGIQTLGFRGEALSSIAAISQMSIQSRTSEEIGGTKIEISENTSGQLVPSGMPKGTIVTVTNLFHSIPARKKFLKSAATEFRHITDVIIHYALIYPSVHFVLTHNQKTVLDLPKKKSFEERIQILLGSSFYDELIPLSYEDGYLKITGFIGRPQLSSKQNQKQYIYVNKRSVTDRVISLAVKESFGSLLPASSTPVFLLDITLPSEMIDVNVHPRKEQIGFINSQHIFDSIKSCVTQALNEHNLTFRMAKYKQEHSAKIGETTSFAGDLLKKSVLSSIKNYNQKIDNDSSIVQIASTYIVSEGDENLLILDQHAVSERILYEEFLNEFEHEKNTKITFELSPPLPLTFSVTDSQIVEEFQELLTKAGFTLEPFQGTTYLLISAPRYCKGRKIEKIVDELIDDLSQETGLKTVDGRTQRMLAFLACRTAVKAGELLTTNEMRRLQKTLANTKNNTTCPHGRPTHMEISKRELDKMFNRR